MQAELTSGDEPKQKRKQPDRPPLAGPPLLHRVKVAAAMLNVGESKLWAMIANGKVASVKVGGARMISQAELERIAREGVE